MQGISLQQLCLNQLSMPDLTLALRDSLPLALHQRMAVEIISRHRLCLLEKRYLAAVFSRVMNDLVLAVACHECGSRKVQTCIRGIHGKFCSRECFNSQQEKAEDDEYHINRCFWEDACLWCSEGMPLSLVRYSAPSRDKRRKLDGPFWPMAPGLGRCDNWCIINRPPMKLPNVNSAKLKFLEEGNSLGKSVKRRLEF